MIARAVLLCAWILSSGAQSAFAQGPKPASKPSRKVLVELYTSQGCNSCPSANDFLGELAQLGYGPDRIVPIAFHVDYFNEPWVDPFSSKDHSRRELAYNSVLKRDDLYFTPMMMIDGRAPMLGSNRAEAIPAIRKALAEPPGASLRLSLEEGKAEERKLSVGVQPLSTGTEGRTLMVGVAVTEGPISTKVRSGENGGRTLVEPFVARTFAYQKIRLDRGPGQSLTFPLKLAGDAVASKTRIAVFLQDWDNGRVYQADSIPWVIETPASRPAH